MGKVLTIISTSDIKRFEPAPSEFMRFDSVVCPNVLHFAKNHVEYEEWLAKITYCAKKTIFLEMRWKETPQSEHSFGDKPSRLAGHTPITYRRLSLRLADMGFKFMQKHYTGTWRNLLVADRMPRIPYVKDMDFMGLTEGTVVSDVPIDHPMWDNLWPLIEKREPAYYSRVRDLRTSYKAWMDEPIWFALDKERVVQGSHRMSLHKLMNKPTIDMRIMRTWWGDDPKIHKPEKIKEQLEYIHGV